MIDALITSKTRIKLLSRLFLNENARAYLRGMATEFGESSNSIRLELNRFESAGLLSSSQDGMRKVFRANTGHPLYDDIKNILMKHLGFDHIIEKVIDKLGDVSKVYVTGDYARGLDSGTIHLIILGNGIDEPYLNDLVKKTEKLIKRMVSFTVCNPEEEETCIEGMTKEHLLLLWKADASDVEGH
jgi:hypothetical protein